MTACRCRGFTLVEVLVALGIVAIALAAGLQATAAQALPLLVRWDERVGGGAMTPRSR